MRKLFAIAALALAARAASAQVTSGTYTDGQGYSCKVEVSDTNGSGTPGVDVTLTDAGGSATANGAQASGSTDSKPTAQSFPSTTTPRGAAEVRGANGKVQKKNASGKWIDLRKVPKKKSNLPRTPLRSQVWQPTWSAPNNVGSMPGGPQPL